MKFQIISIISILFIYKIIEYILNRNDPIYKFHNKVIDMFITKPNKIDLEYSLKFNFTENLDLISDNSERFTMWYKPNKEFFLTDTFNKKFVDFIPNMNTYESLLTKNCGLSIENTNKNTNKNTNYRLYLHQKMFPYRINNYHSINWSENESENKIKTGIYKFYRCMYDENKNTPIDIIKKHISEPYLSKILEICNKFYNETNSFFVKYHDHEIIGIDFIFIPYKNINEIIPTIEEQYKYLQIRHLQITFTLIPVITFYISANNIDINEIKNKNFHEIKQIINKNSYLTKFQMNHYYYNIESNTNIIENLYDSGSIDLWKNVLGNELHYHAGISNDDNIDIFIHSIKKLYPYIGNYKTIVDIGCGWGGPMELISRELECEILGITNSRKQFDICRSRDLDVLCIDAENMVIPGYFDIAMLIESLEHIKNKELLLTKLNKQCTKLIMRVNCNNLVKNNNDINNTFGDSMIVSNPDDLKNIIIKSGWTIIHWEDIRYKTKQSCTLWLERLNKIPKELIKDHLKILYDFCSKVVNNKEVWSKYNPLIEVVAINSQKKPHIEKFIFNEPDNDIKLNKKLIENDINGYVEDNAIPDVNELVKYFRENCIKKHPLKYSVNSLGILIQFNINELDIIKEKYPLFYNIIIKNIDMSMNHFIFNISMMISKNANDKYIMKPHHDKLYHNGEFINILPEKVSIGYLEGPNEGGELELFNKEKSILIKPLKGRICHFKKVIHGVKNFNILSKRICFVFAQFTSEHNINFTIY